jgi:hypothetical protein
VRTMTRYRERELVVITLGCGCWFKVSEKALEQFADAYHLDHEALTERVEAQHVHKHPARLIRVTMDTKRWRGDPDWRRAQDRRVTLHVVPGHSAPLEPRPQGECS